MHAHSRRFLPTATALLAVLVLAGCGGDDGTGGTAAANSTTPTAAAESSSEPATADERNDADVTFVQMMIPHHAQAIEMSDLMLGKGDADDSVTALAEQVVAAQQPEIDMMTGWLEEWGEDVPEMGAGMAMDHPMNGMLSQSDVDAIGEATDADAARLYLEGLKAHHEGAIQMAQSEVDNGMNAEVIGLAETIIEMQQAEISEIDGLLTSM